VRKIKLLLGKWVSEKIEDEIRKKLLLFKSPPVLGIIKIGEHSDALFYQRGIERVAKRIGAKYVIRAFPENIGKEDFSGEIKKINRDKDINGYIVLLPLPPYILPETVFEQISPDKDAEGVTPYNLGKILLGEPVVIPPTPLAVLEIFEKYKISVRSKNVVIIGRSKEVGMPLANLLISKKKYGNATVTVCHSKTKEIKKITKRADILIVSIGKPLFVKRDWIKRGAVVIDVGINLHKGKIVGDVDLQDVKDKASAITPVPGGVGVITSHLILKNLIKIYERSMLNNG